MTRTVTLPALRFARLSLGTLFFCLSFLDHSALAAESKTSDKPNLIFILSDGIEQGDLGCYGQQLIKTPNLDRMAAEGTRYLQDRKTG